MGTALLKAAEEDARNQGAKGMVAWGLWLPFWMRASWFKKHGYHKAERQGLAMLMWKRFCDSATPPKWYRRCDEFLQLTPGKVTITAFSSGWCMAQNLVYERAKRAASEFGDKVIFKEISTFERDIVAKWGIVDDVFVDNKKLQNGPPLTYKKILTVIAKKVAKLNE